MRKDSVQSQPESARVKSRPEFMFSISRDVLPLCSNLIHRTSILDLLVQLLQKLREPLKALVVLVHLHSIRNIHSQFRKQYLRQGGRVARCPSSARGPRGCGDAEPGDQLRRDRPGPCRWCCCSVEERGS